MVRLSHDEIKQIIAEHMGAKYGGSADVEIHPAEDIYGNEIRATVSIRDADGLYRRLDPQMDEARSVQGLPCKP